MQDHDVSRVPIQLVRQCVVASIQIEMDPAALDRFRTDLLEALQRTNATGVVLDVSGIEIMDLAEFEALRQTLQMAELMGASTVFSGFRPGVVSSLVELDARVCDVAATSSLDDALDLLDVDASTRTLEQSSPEDGQVEAGEETNAILRGPLNVDS